MDCSVTNTSGTFGTCSQIIKADEFNKDSVFWYIEKEDTVYNFNLTLFPFLSSTPLKLVYPRVDAYNLKTLDRERSFPQFFDNDPQLLPSLMPFSLGSTNLELNIQKTDEPAISFDKINNIFDLSFIGRLPKGLEGVCIFNYRFKKSGQILNPYSLNAYTPTYDTWGTAFGDGYLSPNIDLQTYPKSTGLFLFPLSVAGEEFPCNYGPPCEDITAVHALQRDTLKMNCTCLDTLSTFGNNVTFVNYISSFDPSEQIVVTFDLASYYDITDEYLCTNHSDIVCDTRTVSSYGPTEPGEGFCVYFHTLTSYEDFIGSGPGSCLGYAPASAVNVDQYGGHLMNFKRGLYGSHLGVGFDIGGDFHTDFEGKSGVGSRSANSITLRSSINEDNQVLYTRNLSASGLTLAQPITSTDDIQFNTFKLVLDSNGRRIRAYVLDCDTDDFLELLCYEASFTDACDLSPNVLTPGISFSTGSRSCSFELRSLNIQGKYKTAGVDVCNPIHVPTPTPTCPLFLSPTPTPSITPTETVTPTVTPTNTVTPTVTPTETVTPTVTPTSTVTPTLTPTPTVTISPGASPSNTPTVTPTSTVTPTVTPTNTVTPTVTPTNTPTNSPSNTPSSTPPSTPPASPPNTPPASPTSTPTSTPPPASASSTPTPTPGYLTPADGYYYIKIGIANDQYPCGLPDSNVSAFLNTNDLLGNGAAPVEAVQVEAFEDSTVHYSETKFFKIIRVNQAFLNQPQPGNNQEVSPWDIIACEARANILTFNNSNIYSLYTDEEYDDMGKPCGDQLDSNYPIPEPSGSPAKFDENVQRDCCFYNPDNQTFTAGFSYASLSDAANAQWNNGYGERTGSWADPFIIIQSPS